MKKADIKKRLEFVVDNLKLETTDTIFTVWELDEIFESFKKALRDEINNIKW